MAEPAKTAETNPPAPVTAQVDVQKLNDAIVQGLSAGLKPVIERISESNRTAAPAHVAAAPPAAIVRPSQEAISQATIDGNTAELARLLNQQRAADDQERRAEMAAIRSQGGGALGSVAKQLAQNLPYYKRFQKEIDTMVDEWQSSNPGAIVTFDHYKFAEETIKGRHVDDLLNERAEEAIRKAREPEVPIEPSGGRRLMGQADSEREPTSIEDLYPGFANELKTKSRKVGGRSEEQELYKMGFRGGFADVLKAKKEIEALQETYGEDGVCGLDMDWTDSKGRQGKNADKNDGSWTTR